MNTLIIKIQLEQETKPHPELIKEMHRQIQNIANILTDYGYIQAALFVNNEIVWPE